MRCLLRIPRPCETAAKILDNEPVRRYRAGLFRNHHRVRLFSGDTSRGQVTFIMMVGSRKAPSMQENILPGVIFFIILFVAIAFAVGIAQYVALQRAKTAYLESLEALKRDPHNPELREFALVLGRKYVAAAQKVSSLTAFDELSLMNDINAACARAGSKVTIETDRRNPTLEERLANLDGIREKGLITQEEYQRQRQRILDNL